MIYGIIKSENQVQGFSTTNPDEVVEKTNQLDGGEMKIYCSLQELIDEKFENRAEAKAANDLIAEGRRQIIVGGSDCNGGDILTITYDKLMDALEEMEWEPHPYRSNEWYPKKNALDQIMSYCDRPKDFDVDAADGEFDEDPAAFDEGGRKIWSLALAPAEEDEEE